MTFPNFYSLFFILPQCVEFGKVIAVIGMGNKGKEKPEYLTAVRLMK